MLRRVRLSRAVIANQRLRQPTLLHSFRLAFFFEGGTLGTRYQLSLAPRDIRQQHHRPHQLKDVIDLLAFL